MRARGALRASLALARMRFPPRATADGVTLSTLPAEAHARELARLARVGERASLADAIQRRRPPRALGADRVPEAVRRATREVSAREMRAVDSGGADEVGARDERTR